MAPYNSKSTTDGNPPMATTELPFSRPPLKVPISWSLTLSLDFGETFCIPIAWSDNNPTWLTYAMKVDSSFPEKLLTIHQTSRCQNTAVQPIDSG